MAEPENIPLPLIDADELCLPRDQENQVNNHFLDFDQISCQHPILLEILKEHPLFYTLSDARGSGGLRTTVLELFEVRQGEHTREITLCRENRQPTCSTHSPTV